MSTAPKIPREYRGTDLQFAWLDGVKDGSGELPVPLGPYSLYCEPERLAFLDGQREGQKLRTDSGSGGV